MRVEILDSKWLPSGTIDLLENLNWETQSYSSETNSAIVTGKDSNGIKQVEVCVHLGGFTKDDDRK